MCALHGVHICIVVRQLESRRGEGEGHVCVCVVRNAGSSSRDAAGVKDSPKKLKALQETILKMNEKNYKLQTENKTLKQDLDKMMQGADKVKADQGSSI